VGINGFILVDRYVKRSPNTLDVVNIDLTDAEIPDIEQFIVNHVEVSKLFQ